MANKPKVSVVAIAYNHGKYVRQALEGFVAQKTNFTFEVIVADDRSKDDTPKIIAEYAEKYPEVIKPILRKKNIGAWPNFIDTLKRAKGEYIAICEGDDYWTDPLKLQTQVDFMDKHPSYAVCFHKVNVVYEKGEKPTQVYPDVEDESWYTLEELFKLNYIQTNSVLYRRQDYTNIPMDVMPGDWFMHLYHANFGKIKMIDRVMSVYRKHEEGMWWNYDNDRQAVWKKYGFTHLTMWIELLKLYRTPKFKKLIFLQVNAILRTIFTLDKEYHRNVLKKVADQYPEVIVRSLMDQYDQIKELEAKNDELEQKARTINELQEELESVKHTLRLIKGSKVWRARNAVAARLGRKPV